MNKNLTDITLLLDRSGSMMDLYNDVIGGYKEFIKTQKEVSGKCNFTLVHFDTVNPQEVVHQALPIENVSENLLFQPRGGTPLLDALGLAIVSTGERLANMPENERPANVVFVVFTDGYENSSHEYTKEKIKQMVTHQQETYKWNFIFLGAGIDAFADAHSMGVLQGTTSSLSKNKTFDAIKMTSDKIKRYRASGQAVSLNYSNEDRALLK